MSEKNNDVFWQILFRTDRLFSNQFTLFRFSNSPNTYMQYSNYMQLNYGTNASLRTSFQIIKIMLYIISVYIKLINEWMDEGKIGGKTRPIALKTATL